MEKSIDSNSEKAVEKHKIESVREEIQMAIIRKTIASDREITIEQIIEELEKQGIINSGDGNSETGQVKTQPDGYIYEIKEKANGDWEVIYIGKGELTLPELLITLSPNTTGITSSVTITMTAKEKSGITSYTLPKGTEQSVESGTKEIIKTYTATENGTYTFTVTNGNGKTESKSITIDNILEGTIQISAIPSTPTKGNITITPSKTTPTNQNITVSVTWPSDTTGYTKKISTNNGSTWSEYTGAVTISGNCVVKARLFDSTEQYGQTATCEITNIDKTNPTVTAKEEAVTIKEGDSHSLGEYFTITANGTYGIASTVYTDTSNGNTEVTNTNTLAVGTHVIKCTVIKETGATANAIITIVVETAEFVLADKALVGQYVEYIPGDSECTKQLGTDSNQTLKGSDYTGTWQILRNQNGIVYLISSRVTGNLNIKGSGPIMGYSLTNGGAYSPIDELANVYTNSEYATEGKSIGNLTGNYETDLTYLRESGLDEIGESYLFNSFYKDGDDWYIYAFDINYAISAGVGRELYGAYIGAFDASDRMLLDSVTVSYGLRPVIILKENIKASEGDGSQENPYKLIPME